VLHNLGYGYGGENVPAYQKLHPAFLIMCPLMAFVICNRFSQLYVRKKLEIYFLLFLGISIIYIYVNDLTGSIAYIPNTLLLPLCFSICLNERNFSFLMKLKKLIILFFVFNSTLAIVEMLVRHNFFTIYDYDTISHFRSTAFQGHPLNNALVTSVIMAFILMSGLRERTKNILLLLGLVSIVCYGARGSLLVLGVMLFFYLLAYNPPINFPDIKNIRRKRKQRALLVLTIVLITTLVIVYTPYGARIFELRSLDDSSTGVRIESLKFFNIIDIHEYLWGASDKATETITDKIEVEIIENFWILWVIRFGLILTVGLSFLFIKFFYQKVKRYGKFASFFIPVTFLAVASTNNSLASSTPIISIYVLCAYAFNPLMYKTKKIHDT
jgi:hypothetical protein